MPHFQQGAPGQRCIFERPAALTAALPIPTKHCKNRDFPPSYAAHPIFERMTGSILERIGRKKAPHYRTQQHICCCVQFRGAFFSPIGSRMRFFFRAHGTNENDKTVFPLVKGQQFSGQQPLNVHQGLSSNAFKNGALMLRNINTPLLHGYTRAMFERFNSPLFTPYS